jgi:hypothetical protein
METPEQTIEQTVDAPVEQTEVVTQTTPDRYKKKSRLKNRKLNLFQRFNFPPNNQKTPLNPSLSSR